MARGPDTQTPVLDYVRTHDLATRRDIAEGTGLHYQQVANATKYLCSLGKIKSQEDRRGVLLFSIPYSDPISQSWLEFCFKKMGFSHEAR